MTCRPIDGVDPRVLCLDSSLEVDSGMRPDEEDLQSGVIRNFQLQEITPAYHRGQSRRVQPSLGVERLFQTPSHPTQQISISHLIYDLSQQLEGFELNASVRIPVTGLGPGGSRMDTWTQATLREHGAVALLGVTLVGGTASRPFPGAVFNILGDVPIIAPFFRFRILRVFINPSTRRLQARIEYLCIPVNLEAHQQILDQLSLAPPVLRGPDYDLRQNLPPYAWQFAEIVERFLAEQARRQHQGAPPPVAPASAVAPRIEPLLDQAEIWVDGNFSNRSLSLLGLTVHFAELRPGSIHRLRVSGHLLSPTITVNGIESADFNHLRANLHLVDGGNSAEPLVMQLTLDPHSQEGLLRMIRIPHYQSRQIFLEAISTRNPEDRVTLSLEQGFSLRNFAMNFSGSEPSFSIDSLDVRQMAFDGFGVHLATSPGDAATLTNLHVTPGEGLANVEADIHGQASGTVDYFLGNERRGHLNFNYLNGEGSFRVVGEPGQPTRFELRGRFLTEMSELRLLARSQELNAYAETVIQDATVRGEGILSVWPFESRILVESGAEPLLVEGHRGQVIFHQDPSLVPRWSELRQILGSSGDSADSHVTIQVHDIHFRVPQLGLQSHMEEGSGRPVLRVDDAQIEDIHIRGDIEGTLLFRLLGRYYPIGISQNAPMRDATFNIHGLRDDTDATGHREVRFSGIEISGEESVPTFSLRDQRRCYGHDGQHYDRQHVHVSLGTFQFNPDERQVQLADIGEHFHIIARDILHGGCLIVE